MAITGAVPIGAAYMPCAPAPPPHAEVSNPAAATAAAVFHLPKALSVIIRAISFFHFHPRASRGPWDKMSADS